MMKSSAPPPITAIASVIAGGAKVMQSPRAAIANDPVKITRMERDGPRPSARSW
jgi:hypothetical protein